ncbi:ETX/MTX2 family pore-forming toxin [Crocosphaera sp. XPORK-15E]|uniref:ETX/MTX2 family pore-forming toxin n=1 Tax=Crocosphaera sp. XPORK-15E TaxID=3110247 RepID=UPI002B1F05FD|nr:ETX/MTX2 family pore-forming toxin [Crocosphaera sp. XPORK-15E]MEA5534827.1 ETX/MTX2 family pore-forming toxin [Crocosphaera sp. XPORK-15E]
MLVTNNNLLSNLNVNDMIDRTKTVGGNGGSAFVTQANETQQHSIQWISVYAEKKIIRGLKIWYDGGDHSRVDDPLTLGTPAGKETRFRLGGKPIDFCTLYYSDFRGGRLGGIILRLNDGSTLQAGDLNGRATTLSLGEYGIRNTVLVGLFGRKGKDIDQLGLIVKNDITQLNIEHIDYNLVPTSETNLKVEALDFIRIDNQSDISQTSSITHTRSVNASNNWSHNVGAKVGVSTSIKTGIPFIAEGKVDVSLEASYNYTWGGTLETSDSFEYTATATVPPHSEIEAQVLVTQTKFDLTYTAQASATWANGMTMSGVIHGTYEGIHSHDVQIDYSIPKTHSSQKRVAPLDASLEFSQIAA